MTRSLVSHTRTAVLVAGIIPATLAGAGAPQLVVPGPPASGHAQVIAQSVVEFADGPHVWRARQVHATPPGSAVAEAPQPPAFLLAASGTVIAVDAESGEMVRLSEGEGTYVSTSGFEVRAESSGANLWAFELLLVAASNDPIPGDSFTPGVGVRDVDLLRDVLTTGETLTVADQDVPALVLVTAGSVRVGDATVLAAGVPATFDGPLSITNPLDDKATVIVGLVGPVVELDEAPTTTPSDAPTSTAASPTASANPATTTETSLTVPTSPATTTSPIATTSTTTTTNTDVATTVAPTSTTPVTTTTSSLPTTSAPSPPTALDDAATWTFSYLGSRNMYLLSNDQLGYPPGEVVSFGGGTLFENDTVESFAAGTTAHSPHGVVTVGADGVATMLLAPGTHTFVYRIANSEGLSDATATVTVLPDT